MPNAYFKRLPERGLTNQKNTVRWPTLEKAEQIGCISYIDLAFADLVLENSKEANELAAAFLCHLSLAAREGHLCVFKKDGLLFPPPEELWLSGDFPTNFPELSTLFNQLKAETIALPTEALTDVSEEGALEPITPICHCEGRYYYQKSWLFETSIIKSLQSKLAEKPTFSPNDDQLLASIAILQESSLLNQEQANAIINASHTCFSILSGGPGTGKTYTAGQLIKTFWQALDETRKKDYKIVLAAPTGKAANNLQKSMSSALKEVSDFQVAIQAKTLHSLLNIRNYEKTESQRGKKIDADLLIVDESSMIDIRLLSYLFDAVKTGARLILLGDPHQLPPVEAGSGFKDIIKRLNKSENPPISELKTCLRAELKEIIEFSEKVNLGDMEGVLNHLKKSDRDTAVTQIQIPSNYTSKQTLHFLLELTEDASIRPNEDPLKLLHSIHKFRILSPLKNGFLGFQEINCFMHNKNLSKIPYGEYITAPIMIAANDYKLDLFNGEVGVLVSRKKRDASFESEDFAIFGATYDAPYRKIAAVLLPKFEYAYCLSVHKSQGSEFERVLLVLPEGSERFGREVLYTGVTRAKRNLQIFSSEETLKKTLMNTSERLSGLLHRY